MKNLSIKITIIMGLLLSNLIASGLKDNKDHDYRHITFINQTDKKIKFAIDSGVDDMALKSHTANYKSIKKCENKDYRKNHVFHITFQIDIKGGHNKWIKNNKGHKKTIKRKCGESLYLYKKGKKYYASKKPHVKADLSGCNTNTSKKPILFVHGYNDTQKAWKTYAKHANHTREWRAFRTSVSQDGSMKKRAHMLAKYINGISESCKVKNGSLRVVAHSMGGLDIRYLVSNPHNSSELATAAKKIERIYTLATPHKGDTLGNFVVASSDAGRDLTKSHMNWFNSKNKYKAFKVEGRKIPLLALRFSCNGKNGSDGVVNINNQTYTGAPRSKNVYRARHTTKVCLGTNVPELETEMTNILDHILHDHHGKNIPLK